LFYRLFASLASDKSAVVPYSRELADQRRKYGDVMLRKGDEHLATQRQFESETQARLDAARQKRQEERERQETLEVSCVFVGGILSIVNFIRSENGWKSFGKRLRY
jgi:hypothetical protein